MSGKRLTICIVCVRIMAAPKTKFETLVGIWGNLKSHLHPDKS